MGGGAAVGPVHNPPLQTAEGGAAPPAQRSTESAYVRASKAPSTLPPDQKAEEQERAKHVLKQWMHTPSSVTPLLNPNKIQVEVYQRGKLKFTSILQKCTTIVGREPEPGAFIGGVAVSEHIVVPHLLDQAEPPISRCHVLLAIDVAGKMYVIDKSQNGSYLNKGRLLKHSPQQFNLHDRIKLGSLDSNQGIELVVTHGVASPVLRCIDERGHFTEPMDALVWVQRRDTGTYWRPATCKGWTDALEAETVEVRWFTPGNERESVKAVKKRRGDNDQKLVRLFDTYFAEAVKKSHEWADRGLHQEVNFTSTIKFRSLLR